MAAKDKQATVALRLLRRSGLLARPRLHPVHGTKLHSDALLLPPQHGQLARWAEKPAAQEGGQVPSWPCVSGGDNGIAAGNIAPAAADSSSAAVLGRVSHVSGVGIPLVTTPTHGEGVAAMSPDRMGWSCNQLMSWRPSHSAGADVTAFQAVSPVNCRIPVRQFASSSVTPPPPPPPRGKTPPADPAGAAGAVAGAAPASTSKPNVQSGAATAAVVATPKSSAAPASPPSATHPSSSSSSPPSAKATPTSSSTPAPPASSGPAASAKGGSTTAAVLGAVVGIGAVAAYVWGMLGDAPNLDVHVARGKVPEVGGSKRGDEVSKLEAAAAIAEVALEEMTADSPEPAAALEDRVEPVTPSAAAAAPVAPAAADTTGAEGHALDGEGKGKLPAVKEEEISAESEAVKVISPEASSEYGGGSSSELVTESTRTGPNPSQTLHQVQEGADEHSKGIAEQMPSAEQEHRGEEGHSLPTVEPPKEEHLQQQLLEKPEQQQQQQQQVAKGLLVAGTKESSSDATPLPAGAGVATASGGSGGGGAVLGGSVSAVEIPLLLVEMVKHATSKQAEEDQAKLEKLLQEIETKHEEELGGLRTQLESARRGLEAFKRHLHAQSQQHIHQLDLQQQQYDARLERELESAAEKAKADVEQAEALAKARAEALIAIGASQQLEDAEELWRQMASLREAFFARSEEARKSYSAHQLAMCAFVFENALASGSPFPHVLPLLTHSVAASEGGKPDELVAAVTHSLPEGLVETGALTRAQLQLRLGQLEPSLRQLAVLHGGEGGGGALAYLAARLAAALKRVEHETSLPGGGAEAAIGRAEALLSEGQLVKAADALVAGVAGTRAAEVAEDWARQVRLRAAAEQALDVLQAHAAVVASSLV